MFKPKSIITCTDGWQTPVDRTYVHQNGTTFEVPPKNTHHALQEKPP